VIPIAIGVGLVVSMVFSEILGVAAGGMVVPGYLALVLAEPWRAAATVGAGIVTFLIVRVAGRFMLMYGRRHITTALLVGLLCWQLVRTLSGRPEPPDFVSFEAVAYLIPGLIAYWMEREGVVQTLAGAVTAAVLVRLVLIVAMGGAPIDIPAW